MEIEGTDGSKTTVKQGSKLEWGRRSGFNIDDRTVSRRHIELQPLSLSGDAEPRVRFIVLGKNPIWVHRSKTGEVNAFKSSESGEMEIGDAFCVSAKNPVWFTCNSVEIEVEKKSDDTGRGELGLDSELAESLTGGYEINGFDLLELESIDSSHIDPVKDFGFLVIGEEFKSYPKKMIKDIQNWDWFIEEGGAEGNGDDDQLGESKSTRRRKRKKKSGQGEDDEEWTGDSEEEEMELISEERKVLKMPKYSTRSKDRHQIPAKDAGKKKKKTAIQPNVDEEDEDGVTLGGFIVNDEESELEAEDEEEEEEEELDD